MGSIHRLGGIVVGVGLVMGLTTAMTSPDRLRQAMTELTESGAAGVQVRVDDDSTGAWVSTAGVRTLAGGQVPAHGYYGYVHEGNPRVLDTSRANPSWAGASGDMISTTEDLSTFIDALYDRELISGPLLAEMRQWRPSGRGGYGLGIREWRAECGTVYEGHTGGMNGHKAFLFRTDTRRVAVSITIGAIDAQDPVTDDRLDDAVDTVLNAAFC